MSQPEIKIIAVSNVFSRLMHFKNAGDVEQGHTHSYDHATLVSSGSVKVDVVSSDGNIVSSKEFKAPEMIFIKKDLIHKLTALEDNTVCACIHALRTIDQEIISPEFFIDPLHSSGNGDIKNEIYNRLGKPMGPILL